VQATALRHSFAKQRATRAHGYLSREPMTLASILLAGLVFRLWWLFTHTYAIENDGAEYARIASNLVHGHGYVGLQTGPELLFPPLYPTLMAALSPVLSIEHAGRAVSMIFGTALPLIVYLIGRRLYGRPTARVAAAIVALNPLLAAYSTAVLSETTYITLQLTAAYLLLRAHDRRSLRLALAAGCVWALAALVRPEALLILGFLTVAGLVWTLRTKAERRRSCAVAGLAFAVGCIAFLPYAAWTSGHAGRLQWSGKATVTSFINQRIEDGEPYVVATAGVDQSGRPTGVLLQPNAFIDGARGHAAVATPNEISHFERNGLHRLWSYFGRHMLLGAPFVLPLALIGLFAGPFTRRMSERHALLLLIAAADVAVFGSIGWFEFRFLLPLVPVGGIFAARGAVRAAELVTGKLWRTRADREPWRHAALTGLQFLVIGVLSLLPLAAQPNEKFPSLGQVGTPLADEKVVGSWLNHHGGDGQSLMSNSATLAYYAGAVWYPMGYTASDQAAVSYLEHGKPRNLVVSSTADDPYELRWLKNGVPDTNYTLARTFVLSGVTIVVYQRATPNG
jgi:4-amino-4-deoxy-L-arabinose transferase-like glycosyltransferase